MRDSNKRYHVKDVPSAFEKSVSEKEKKEALQKECNNFVSCTILRWFFGGAAFAFVVIDYINSKM